ncbi:MAG: hypothetical protein FJW36_16770 [Acidobacteria bacterium]|nr:hypothetical protein [Acidobacteriota bacterium]
MRPRLSLALVAFAICAYYLWASQRFNPLSPNGYYNYLARGWAEGHLYVPIAPDPRLLAQPNPYDPNLPDEIKIHDMVLYKGRYYLYHGAGPALAAFYPYKKLTGKDLPESIAVFFFVSIAFIANALTLLHLKPTTTPLQLAALGLANGIPFLLHRIFVYEVAIAFGQATLSIATALLIRNQNRWGGFVLGLVVLSRPHLLLAAIFAKPRCWLTVPIGLLIAAVYNQLRFGSPFEFGLRYLISGPGQQQPSFQVDWLLPSLYLFLLEPPTWLREFPFIAIPRNNTSIIPPHFFHENIMGALWLSPFALAQRPIWRLALPALAILGFLCCTGWVTQRYAIDFLPRLVLAALAAPATSRLQIPLILAAIALNVLSHIQGPYNAP